MLIIPNQKRFNSKLKMQSISTANNSTVTANLAVLSWGKHLAWLIHVFNTTGPQAWSTSQRQQHSEMLIQVADPQLHQGGAKDSDEWR